MSMSMCVTVRMTPRAGKCKIWTVKSYDEYCPIAMGAEIIGDRWTPLVLRELMCGSERFTEIHNGVPRMSRTLLAQRLKHLERTGVIERDGPAYRLSASGRELEPVVWGMGEWANQWLVSDPAREHLDGGHLLWRVRQRLVSDALPARRIVVYFDFLGATRRRRVWLVLDPAGASVCERDEGFEPDVRVTADIVEFMRIWMGRSTWSAAIADGTLSIEGPRDLQRSFTTWFALSPFAATAPR
jgi:DNA-binding HxlR family transcriptional regulator